MAKTAKNIVATQPREVPSETDFVTHATLSDDEPLSRTDRFFITSMLTSDYPSPVTLSEDTIIGGSTLSSIMELGLCELCNDLKLQDPFESMHVNVPS